MAQIIKLRDYAPDARPQESINSKSADILFFTGVRYERFSPDENVKNQLNPATCADL